MGTRSWRGQRHAPTLVVLAAILLTSIVVFRSEAAEVLPPPGWSLTPVTQTENLVDGQRVTLVLRANPDASPTPSAVEIVQCRLDATYTTEADLRPNAGKCPPIPISSSASLGLVNGAVSKLSRTDDGARLSFVVGVGVVTWESAAGPTTLTCDKTHKCALVVSMVVGNDHIFQLVELSFADDNPVASCGSAAAASLVTAGPDEMSDAWATWTRDYCAANPGGAPTRAAFTGEGEAVKSFGGEGAEGATPPDLVYTASGYSSMVNVAPTDRPRRAAVAVPIALNAAVVGAGGGHVQVVDGEKVGSKVQWPAGSLALSAGEVAALMGRGTEFVNDVGNPYQLSLLARNPILGSVAVARTQLGFLAPSRVESINYHITNYAATLAAADFIQPSGEPLGATANLIRPADFSIDPYTGRPTLGKASLTAFISADEGPIWGLTDRVTAEIVGMTPVKLQNANGAFVEPTDAALRAAVATMVPGAEGMLLPDPAATATSGEQPYPATYVLYALAPAEPLVDTATCSLRSGSQDLMKRWLEYITGAGQATLPPGMVALPDALKAQAIERIGTIGTAAVTGECAGRVTPPPGAAGASSAAPGASALGRGAAGSGSAALTPRSAAANLTSAGPASTSATTATKDDDPRIIAPAFAGRSLAEPFDGALALLAIVIITSLAVSLTARALRGEGAADVGVGRGNTAFLVVLWGAVAAAGVALVVYQIGPMLQQRDQQSLLTQYKREIRQAANETQGLPTKSEADEKAPEPGAPVGIVEIGKLRLQAVAVEGISPSETRKGPGHVPGTAGLGQPGNSVVIARRNSYGAPFQQLENLEPGDKIVVTTTQGQSVYAVRTVKSSDLDDSLYGPSSDNRLTFVTSGSRNPLNGSEAVVVTARLKGLPYEWTTQGARNDAQSSLSEGGTAAPLIVLTLLGYVLVIGLSVLLYRNLQFRVAYVLSLAPIVALTVVTGETLTKIMPAWA